MTACLVTGGAGFIGSHIVDALVARGDRVRVVDNLVTGDRRNLEHLDGQVEFVTGSVCDATTMAAAVDGIDVVFHQAALASVPLSVERPLDTHAACATATLTVLDAARKAGVRRVVYASSSAAYGDRPATEKRETDLPMTLSPYAVAKLAGEYYCHAFYHTYGFETVCLRYFNVFGPRQDPGSPYSAVIPLFITAMLKGDAPSIYGDGLQSRDFTFVQNVVHGNLLAADEPDAVGSTFNMADGQATTLLDLIRLLNEFLGTDVQPVHNEPRAGDVRHSLADISAARDKLHYAPQVSFEDGLRQSIDYYRQLVS